MALPLLFAVTLHEAAHGWIANKLGDKTALMLGRVTLNPVKHIDPFGTIILPILMLAMSHFSFAFGWAKPVPINSKNLKSPRRDMAWVGLFGPLANILMALIWAAIAKLSLLWHIPTNSLANFCYTAGTFGIYINTLLAILNLIPIPPLDGSRIISGLLPPRMNAEYTKIEPYGIWILLMLLFILPRNFLFVPLVSVFNLIRLIFGL